MQICFNLSTDAQRAVNNILLAQVIIQAAAICAQLCMVNLSNSATGVVESESAIDMFKGC